MKGGSLFSGIGGFDLAMERAGIKVEWQVEIDEMCQGVLNRQFPETRRFTDVRSVGRDNLSAVDIVTGGFPCQDLSVAGRRAGLAGERSGLWFEFHRILQELSPRWVLIENVPGLLSSNRGRDFAVLLRGLGELGYRIGWRVLDAQYFGVPQRRRRVFIVGCLTDGRAAEVLFEREGSIWDPPTRREKGEETANDAPTSTLRGFGHGWQGQHNDTNPVIAGTLDRKSTSADRGSQANEAEFIVPIPDPAYSVQGVGSKFGSGRHNQDTFAVRTGQTGANGHGVAEDVSHTLDGANAQAVAFTPQNFGNIGGGYKESDVLSTLDATPGSKQTQLIANWQSGGGKMDDEVAASLRSGAEHSSQFVWQNKQSAGEIRMQDDSIPTMTKYWGTGGNNVPFVGVRRLTPLECERLQGFPDGWTDGQSDSARYRQLGNAVAVPVVEWIIRRIVEVS